MRLHELKTLIQASNINRKLGSLEDSLADVTFLAGVANDCTLSGLVVDGAVKLEIAHALSARGELGASISILRRLDAAGAYDKQALDLSRAEVLATLVRMVHSVRHYI
jgi:ataxia telangiectasia mutated family protein